MRSKAGSSHHADSRHGVLTGYPDYRTATLPLISFPQTGEDLLRWLFRHLCPCVGTLLSLGVCHVDVMCTTGDGYRL